MAVYRNIKTLTMMIAESTVPVVPLFIPAQRNAVAANRQKALTELDRVKKEITANTKALADLSEEARRAGVPPGWLR